MRLLIAFLAHPASFLHFAHLPEPVALAIVGLGFMSLALVRRRTIGD